MSLPAKCRVYWGSHACALPRGHKNEHICAFVHGNECSDRPGLTDHPWGEDWTGLEGESSRLIHRNIFDENQQQPKDGDDDFRLDFHG